MTRPEQLQKQIQKVILQDTGLAALILYLRHCPADSDEVAWTNGSTVHYGNGFFQLPEKQQRGVIVHELLHVALRHIVLGQRLRMQEGCQYRPDWWNLANDAVINLTLSSVVWLELPEFAVKIQTLPLPDGRELSRWSSLELYRHWQNLAKEGEALNLVCIMRDLDPQGENRENPDSRTVRDQDRIWQARIERARAGFGTQGVLRKLNPVSLNSFVHWNQVLQEFLLHRLMPERETSWNQLSRRSTVFHELSGLVEPGQERKSGIRQMGLIIDTSGSIFDELLQQFLRVVNEVLALTGAEGILMTCDMEVQQTITVHGQISTGWQPKGGGGTDFRPSLAAMGQWNPDCCVYLTDLCGTFSEQAPPFPLLWATTTDWPVPYGRKVLLQPEVY